jgi:hypothetical protein
MHRTELKEIIRDVDIACAVRPIVQKHHLSVENTTELLTKALIPRARGVAELVGLQCRHPCC